MTYVFYLWSIRQYIQFFKQICCSYNDVYRMPWLSYARLSLLILCHLFSSNIKNGLIKSSFQKNNWGVWMWRMDLSFNVMGLRRCNQIHCSLWWAIGHKHCKRALNKAWAWRPIITTRASKTRTKSMYKIMFWGISYKFKIKFTPCYPRNKKVWMNISGM